MPTAATPAVTSAVTSPGTSAPGPATQPPRLLLLDGHSLAYRAFFALPVENFSTTTGQPTNAVYGFTSMLINVLRDEQPTHIAVAFDVSRATFRSEEYSEYKANRTTSPSEFKGQVSLIKEVLAALRVTTVELEGFEADDVIATLTTQAYAAGYETLICSGDRDAMQLISDRVTLLYPRKGVSDLARMTPEAVQEKYGVVPGEYPDIAALVGESSDNLPGVPGVGPKTAAKWINQFGSLDEVVNRVDEIKGKAGESLRTHLADVIRNRRINALVCDLTLPVEPTDLMVQPWDREEVHKIFDGLEFRVLRDRLFQTLTVDEPISDEGFEIQGERLQPGAVADWLDKHASGDSRTGVHVQGSWGRGGGDVLAVALATGEDQVAIRDGVAYTPVLARAATGGSLPLAAGSWRLDVTAKGTVENLAVLPVPARDEPLEPGQVRIAMRAVGLNFRDVLIALDMYPGD
ncbi:MAG: 5'-3' exonuclease H3TH domain-containing protein, partial [Nocardioidaceae bacterium]